MAHAGKNLLKEIVGTPESLQTINRKI